LVKNETKRSQLADLVARRHLTLRKVRELIKESPDMDGSDESGSYVARNIDMDSTSNISGTIGEGALELRILHDRSTSAYRLLMLITSNEEFSAKDRIDAEAASCEVALAITKLAFKDPIVLKHFEAYICADHSDLELTNSIADAF
jgi:hypothetical protein